MGGPFRNFEVRDIAARIESSPRVAVAGPLVSTYAPENLKTSDPAIIKVNNADEARLLVKRELARKPDLIKIWFIRRPDVGLEEATRIVEAVVDESHALACASRCTPPNSRPQRPPSAQVASLEVDSESCLLPSASGFPGSADILCARALRSCLPSVIDSAVGGRRQRDAAATPGDTEGRVSPSPGHPVTLSPGLVPGDATSQGKVSWLPMAGELLLFRRAGQSSG